MRLRLPGWVVEEHAGHSGGRFRPMFMVILWSCSRPKRAEPSVRHCLQDTGIGVWPSVEAACAATVRVAETITPKHADVMNEGYKKYRRIYPALHQIARG